MFETVTYPSAISWWLWIPIYTLIIGQGIFIALEGDLWVFAFHLLLGLIIYFLVMRMRYVLSNEQLKIYVGPFLYSTIELINIRKMEFSNNPLSSPAASLKRLAIYYNKWGYVWKRKAQLEINAQKDH
jgi:hypothetical protein